MNPLERYRAAQRRVRRLFDPFTAAHCPSCSTPCCVRPSWVRPVDLILVEELGYPMPRRETVAPLLEAAAEGVPPQGTEPCDFLGPGGCCFPRDLRPFGCTAFICGPMREHLSPEALRAVEAAVEALRAAYQELLAELHQPAP